MHTTTICSKCSLPDTFVANTSGYQLRVLHQFHKRDFFFEEVF